MALSAQKAGKARKFEDRATEKVKLGSMLEDFVQEVYRTRLRKHDISLGVHVYMLMSDNDFLSLVKDYFEGCVVEDWYPVYALKERLTGVALEIVEPVGRVRDLGIQHPHARFLRGRYGPAWRPCPIC